MIKMITKFNNNMPVSSIIKIDDKITNVSFYDGSQSINDADNKICLLNKLISKNDVVLLNDIQKHMVAFDIHPNMDNTYSINSIDDDQATWRNLWAKGEFEAYKLSHNDIIIDSNVTIRPNYEIKENGRLYSDVQSVDSNVIKPNIGYDIYNIDWVGANVYMVAHLCNSNYKNGDNIYEEMTGHKNDDIKIKVLSDISSMNIDSNILPKEFILFIAESFESLDEGKPIYTLNKMPIIAKGKTLKDIRSAFSNMIMASVAECMHYIYYEIYKQYGNIIIVDRHDEIIIETPQLNEGASDNLLLQIKNIMEHPCDIKMPARINKGKL